ncbi:hypothetical protein H5410_005507 [Solanum commersonii]|uniref:Uncharacterized protein n=1 Tax=Solanum commersonii TaxID=4109 RepID=A0A9J6A6Y4_SOLCO|nr:hypothetical protein H5410_005507 [Solanum commersonii]
MGTSKAVILIAMTLLLASIICEGKKIDYGALDRNRIPCDRRTNNMKNCHLGLPANPYVRACEKINRCRNGKDLS